MKAIRRTYLTAGILFFGLCAAKPSLAITGCTNATLSGTYNASLTNIAFQNVINSVNGGAGVNGASGTTGTSGATGTTGVTGTTGASGSTGATSSTSSSGSAGSSGLTGNALSLNGDTPGIGRFFFDGNGNILGLAPGANSNAPMFALAGTYSVASNCTATMNFNSGQRYTAVIVSGGSQVLFMQSDANGNGATGIMQQSANICNQSQYPQSFGFEFFGATTAASGSTGTTGRAARQERQA